MKNGIAPEKPARRRMLLRLCVAACAVASVVAWPQHAHAQKVSPPPVPPAIEAPGGNEAYLEGHAVGTQNYICLPSGSGVAWTLFGPQATLFNDKDGQVITHFLSPNPSESGAPRPAWQHSQDTSTIWGQAIASSNDADFVAPGAIPSASPSRCRGRGRPQGWSQTHTGDLPPPAEYGWRDGALDRLCAVIRLGQEGVRALHGRLFLLQVTPGWPRGGLTGGC